MCGVWCVCVCVVCCGVCADAGVIIQICVLINHINMPTHTHHSSERHQTHLHLCVVSTQVCLVSLREVITVCVCGVVCVCVQMQVCLVSLRGVMCVCGHVYVVYEDTNLYNDMGIT